MQIWEFGATLSHAILTPRPRRRRMQPFGYYTNMVQQIQFIIHTNIQPLPACFYYWISPIFYVKLTMSMEMT